ncbi:hypothetical protein HMPREF0381_0299 [Lachnoanaerobaculum saburreum DSM 3986]|uniref:Uncharacterized protein n=1 Tax=Lachnoanaerobaculum saburreum DSM 3986 TaxID=887325 RepID=E6LJV4_9FIRM|nr:hypothetical protein HMPREF0381_0299 [Lachnoanaerobaculum saburreum DSM 3986]
MPQCDKFFAAFTIKKHRQLSFDGYKSTNALCTLCVQNKFIL